MSIDRKPVEEYFAQLEKKHEEIMESLKNKIMEILSEDTEKLYSIRELAERMGLIKPCQAGANCQEESCECNQEEGCKKQEDLGNFQEALQTLLAEKKIIAYPWPLPETQDTQYYFGIKK